MSTRHSEQMRPRGTTTREDVVGAALAVIDTVGVDRLTIRSVAKLAGAPPMSLYTHFSNKQELLDLVYTELTRRLYGEPIASTRWQDALLELSRHARSVLIEHPRWISILSRPAAQTAVPRRERILKQMVDDGLSPEDAIAALASVMMTTVGLVLVDVTLREPDGQAAMSKRFDRLRAWADAAQEDDDSPVTRAAASRLRRLNLEENFLLAVRSMIAGLDANRTRNGTPRQQ
jgi:AcrR family transcriptional regulator